MNTVNTANLQTVASKTTFVEKLCLKVLSSLPVGVLHIHLPWGEYLKVGTHAPVAEAHLYIKNRDFFAKCFLYGDIGFAEAYIDGDWDSPDIIALLSYFIANNRYAPFMEGSLAQKTIINGLKWINKMYHLGRANTLQGSKKNIAEHYDVGNDFYKLWLDESLTYSSAYFAHPEMDLHEAQYAKYERLAQLLRLTANDHVLEIGCGWGSNAIHMAQKYGCKVTAITLSVQQYDYALERVKNCRLEGQVKILLTDYRKVEGCFDKIVSIEMLEAVGHSYLPVFFKKCHQLLKQNGILALQVITVPDSRFEKLKKGVDYIQKHIFPGSLLPSVAAINRAVNQTGDLTLVHLSEMGLHYARTLEQWHKNFEHNARNILQLGNNESFIRKWRYYFNYCQAGFAMRHINVMQMVYVRPNNLDW